MPLLPWKFETVNIATAFPSFQYSKSFQRIQALLDNQQEVYRLLEKLNDRVRTTYEEYVRQDSGATYSFAMYDILRDAEKGHGFGDEVKYLMGVLSAEDFKQMVAARCAFLDPFVTDRHGAETHRIQWWMIIQDMTENPGSYDGFAHRTRTAQLSEGRGSAPADPSLIAPSTHGFAVARRAPSGHDPAEASLRPSKAPSIAAPTTPCRTAPPSAGSESPASATAAQATVTQVTALYTS